MTKQYKPKDEDQKMSLVGFLLRGFLIIVFVASIILGLHRILEAARVYEIKTTQLHK
jgi:hypothetical protein